MTIEAAAHGWRAAGRHQLDTGEERLLINEGPKPARSGATIDKKMGNFRDS
ncbi:hypothetical protein ACFSQT_31930 [Mesorhizobium calcicola]|uniref:Uncharacterized protein n=1 Tax=Mesorhizobium calcicola TaxID=1300310 RepID=A0ABW4WNW5_9HYPH